MDNGDEYALLAQRLELLPELRDGSTGGALVHVDEAKEQGRVSGRCVLKACGGKVREWFACE